MRRRAQSPTGRRKSQPLHPSADQGDQRSQGEDAQDRNNVQQQVSPSVDVLLCLRQASREPAFHRNHGAIQLSVLSLRPDRNGIQTQWDQSLTFSSRSPTGAASLATDARVRARERISGTASSRAILGNSVSNTRHRTSWLTLWWSCAAKSLVARISRQGISGCCWRNHSGRSSAAADRSMTKDLPARRCVSSPGSRNAVRPRDTIRRADCAKSAMLVNIRRTLAASCSWPDDGCAFTLAPLRRELCRARDSGRHRRRRQPGDRGVLRGPIGAPPGRNSSPRCRSRPADRCRILVGPPHAPPNRRPSDWSHGEQPPVRVSDPRTVRWLGPA